jgi:hypothetical protein
LTGGGSGLKLELTSGYREETSLNTFLIDPKSRGTITSFLSAVGLPDHEHLKQVIALHDRPFTLLLQPDTPIELWPLVDAFTFDLERDWLMVYKTDPEVLIDAIIEMAMFLRGFNTAIGAESPWRVDLAIGAWRVVRQNIKRSLMIPDSVPQFAVELPGHTVTQLDQVTFAGMVFLAGQVHTQVHFPPEAARSVVEAYHRLRRIILTVGLGLGLDDVRTFNQRLVRALLHTETVLLPKTGGSPFDDFIQSSDFKVDDLGEE